MKRSDFPKDSNIQREFTERRRRKDWIVRSVNIIAVVGWICALAGWIFIDVAKPETANFFTRLLDGSVRGEWDVLLLRISVGALAVAFITCVAGFLVNMSRHHRKTDRYNKSIIILGAITFVMLIVFVQKLI